MASLHVEAFKRGDVLVKAAIVALLEKRRHADERPYRHRDDGHVGTQSLVVEVGPRGKVALSVSCGRFGGAVIVKLLDQIFKSLFM